MARLERGENVIVNLRLDTDVETEFVSFDQPWVVCVLERMTADLYNLGLGLNDPQRTKSQTRLILKHVIAETTQRPVRCED